MAGCCFNILGRWSNGVHVGRCSNVWVFVVNADLKNTFVGKDEHALANMKKVICDLILAE